jgi:hypothetical protein
MPKRKLSELVGQCPVTYAGLSRILAAVRDGGVPENSSRQSIARSIRADLAVDTPCGPLIQEVRIPRQDGGYMDWPCCHPGASLSWLCSTCSGFDAYFKGHHRDQPSSPDRPWKLCIYADEAAVGNLLRCDNTRKAWLIYWGIVDMGAQFLSHENNWMLLGVIRTNECKKIMGGISGALRAALAQLFFGANSNFHDTGFLVRTGDGSLIGPIFARLDFLLGDDAALTAFWSTKGAAGNSNCLLCQNLCRLGSGLAQFDPSGCLVDHAEHDTKKFHLHTDDTFWATYDRVLTAAPAALADLEKAFGMVKEPHGLVADLQLRPFVAPILNTMLDFGHVFIIHGLFQFEVTEFLLRAKAMVGIKPEHIHAWFQAWTWPKSEHNPPKTVFNEIHSAHTEFKASSSESLSLYPVLRAFVKDFIGDTAMVAEVRSLMSMFRILDGWKSYQSCGLGDAHEWQSEIELHHGLFVIAYGKDVVKPKHHRALHFGQMLDQFGILQATMVHERRHKQFKEIAVAVKTSVKFERVCTELLLNRQSQIMMDDSQFQVGTFAIGCKPVNIAVSELLPAGDWVSNRTINLNGLAYSVDDVAFMEHEGYKVIVIKAVLTNREGVPSVFVVGDLHRLAGQAWYPSHPVLASVALLRSPAIWSLKSDGGLCVVDTGSIAWRL